MYQNHLACNILKCLSRTILLARSVSPPVISQITKYANQRKLENVVSISKSEKTTSVELPQKYRSGSDKITSRKRRHSGYIFPLRAIWGVDPACASLWKRAGTLHTWMADLWRSPEIEAKFAMKCKPAYVLQIIILHEQIITHFLCHMHTYYV